MAPTLDNLSLDNPLLKTYILYVSILSLKMLFMSVATSMTRIKNNTFISPEDVVFNKKATVSLNESVERVRRAHRNDLENIPIFMLIGFLYILSGPSVFLASMLFRIFTVVRFVHTGVYAFELGPHKTRGMMWMIGFAITMYMGVNLIMSFVDAM